jgi:signal transduction histidine kinase
MNWRSLVGYRGKRRLAREAGATLFQGLRIRLTLWYCTVLGIALILFGVALYVGTRYSLLNPIASDAAAHAQVHEQKWLTGSPESGCPFPSPAGQPTQPPGQGFQMPEQIICFDQDGSLLSGEDTTGLSSAFLTNTLAKKALQTGKPANDIVDAGSSIGQIYRYALAVPNQQGTGNIGVVVVGESIKAQENTLSSLLMLLLSIGGVALLGAGLGGLFLSNRALAPARLAWSNQQRFIADASHELRTPLTLLHADAEVLLRGRARFEEEDAALLQDIVAEAKQMARILDNLLTLARLDSSAVHREHEVVGLAALAQEVARRVQALAAQRAITIKVEISSDPYVIGDSMLLEQAVLILLDNAIKYNRTGGQVTLSTRTKEKRAILEVCDSGIGIAAEHLSYLGERFYRVDKARSREGGGTGLGLSIARSIVLAHDGEFSLASVLEQGTSVTLTFPLVTGEVSGDARAGSV